MDYLRCIKSMIYTVSQKKLCKFVVSELCQISTNFDNFVQKAELLVKRTHTLYLYLTACSLLTTTVGCVAQW